jgi:hypothetical protein
VSWFGLTWIRASSFLATHPKHALTKVMSMAESSTNIFAQLAAQQSHLQLKDFQAAES